MAAGQGDGYRGLAGSVEARPMVSGGPVGVAVKRRLRERGFEAGQAFGERLFGSVGAAFGSRTPTGSYTAVCCPSFCDSGQRSVSWSSSSLLERDNAVTIIE